MPESATKPSKSNDQREFDIAQCWHRTIAGEQSMGTCATSTGRTSKVTRGGREFVNPFDRSEVAATYEAWYSRPGRQADLLEKHLLETTGTVSQFPHGD